MYKDKLYMRINVGNQCLKYEFVIINMVYNMCTMYIIYCVYSIYHGQEDNCCTAFNNSTLKNHIGIKHLCLQFYLFFKYCCSISTSLSFREKNRRRKRRVQKVMLYYSLISQKFKISSQIFFCLFITATINFSNYK